MPKRRGPVNNASLFAKRGNPWLTEREARTDFKRVPAFENPDLDQFTRATKAQRDPSKGALVVRVVRPKGADTRHLADPHRKMANILAKAHAKMRANKITVREKPGQKLNTDEPDFKPPEHHIGPDLIGRDAAEVARLANKGKRKRRKPRKK